MDPLTFIPTILTLETFLIKAKKNFAKILKDMINKYQIDYGNAYYTYLERTYSRYSQVKTIIFGKIPQNLYSIYEFVSLTNKDNIVDTKNIINVIDVNNKIIITGSGGIGKSILMKHFFLDTVVNTCYIPVFIELRKFNISQETLYDFIFHSLTDEGLKIEKEHFEYSIKSNTYIFLFDGLDEIDIKNETNICDEIINLSNKYNNNTFIISSRPSNKFISWNDFTELSVMNLTKIQAISLIKKINIDSSTKQSFLQKLEETLYDSYISFASNPLLLNIMLLTFNKHAIIPEKINEFYEEAFNTLFNSHDASKNSYTRNIKSKLGYQDFKKIFSYFCFRTYFKHEYEFTRSDLIKNIHTAISKFPQYKISDEDYIYDLLNCVCMLINDGLKYKFIHRNFQEYFAALYTYNLLDEEIIELVDYWINSNSHFAMSEYFPILYSMQENKINKIILVPNLKKILNLYNETENTFSFLQKIIKFIYIENVNSINYKYKIEFFEEYKLNYLNLNYFLNSNTDKIEAIFSSFSLYRQHFIKLLYLSLLDNDKELLITDKGRTYFYFTLENTISDEVTSIIMKLFESIDSKIICANELINKCSNLLNTKSDSSILERL